ncbi:hypothetical protein G6F29_014029 [Rhizopus arrhizus]|nr:hypothetical protein G6F29_014029 [Rhizopus arrhizus]
MNKLNLLCENQSKVGKDIREFLDTNSADNWSAMKLVKEIVTKYLIIDADSDVALVSAQYEKALNVFKNHKDTQKAEEAIRRLPAIDALMKSSHIMNEFRSQITSDIQAAAVVAMKSNVVEQTHREITGQQMRPHQQQMKQQQSASSAQPQQQDTKRHCEPYTPLKRALQPS